MIDRRRFLFLGAGFLASGALVPRSPLEELEAFLDVGREHFGPSFVLSFRDDFTPALERCARQMKRFGDELLATADRIRFASSPGGILLPRGLIWSPIPPHPMCRCYIKGADAARNAADAIEEMRLPLEQLADRSAKFGRLYQGEDQDETNDCRPALRAADTRRGRGSGAAGVRGAELEPGQPDPRLLPGIV